MRFREIPNLIAQFGRNGVGDFEAVGLTALSLGFGGLDVEGVVQVVAIGVFWIFSL